MTQTEPSSRATISPDLSGIERAIESTTKHRTTRFSAFVAQWDVLLTVYRHTIEMPFLINAAGAPTAAQHRMVLTNILGMSEAVWVQSQDVDPTKFLELTGYKNEFVSSNLAYLRDKYEAWFSEIDPKQLENDERVILDALTKVA